jgi:hypothetical protein
MLPELALGLAAQVANAIEKGKLEDLTSDEVSAAIFASHFLRSMFGMARRSIEASLCAGVDAKTFVAQYEGL